MTSFNFSGNIENKKLQLNLEFNGVQAMCGDSDALSLGLSVEFKGGEVPEPSDPVSQLEGLFLWLKSESLTLGNDEPIDEWHEDSQSGLTLTASADARPKYFINQVNGFPSVRFDGIDDSMESIFPLLNSDDERYFFLVEKIITSPSGGNSKGFLGFGNSLTNRFDLQVLDNFGPFLYSENSNNSAYTISSNVSIDNQWEIVCFKAGSSRLNGGNSKIIRNGTVIKNHTMAHVLPPSPMILGRWSSGINRFFNYDLAEIIGWQKADDDDNINVIGQHLATKYGLTWSA